MTDVKSISSRSNVYREYMKKIVRAARQKDISQLLELLVEVLCEYDHETISEEEYSRLTVNILRLSGGLL